MWKIGRLPDGASLAMVRFRQTLFHVSKSGQCTIRNICPCGSGKLVCSFLSSRDRAIGRRALRQQVMQLRYVHTSACTCVVYYDPLSLFSEQDEAGPLSATMRCTKNPASTQRVCKGVKISRKSISLGPHFGMDENAHTCSKRLRIDHNQPNWGRGKRKSECRLRLAFFSGELIFRNSDPLCLPEYTSTIFDNDGKKPTIVYSSCFLFL